VRGIRVLKAVSSPLRLQILNLLFDAGPLSYTELMSSLKMNPGRDAGRFAYHLKFLLKAELIEADVETRKYCLTELGKMVIDVADRVEKKALKPKRMLVRASRLALEEFDANKIAGSLIREAKMPAELAQKVAKEVEGRLLKSKTKYLTAPLVREVVNAILVEKGMEEYRHELTRLGLPVHEVAMLLEAKSKPSLGSVSIRGAAGDAVLREYTLLKALPRDIADAHLSGSLHISDLGSWILRPTEVVHDLRFFYQNGLDPEGTDSSLAFHSSPQNLESALSMIFDVLLCSVGEVSGTQTLGFFNVFLGPFARGTEPTRAKEALRSFLLRIGQHADVSLSLELTVPGFIADKPAIGPLGKTGGGYGEFVEETQLLASLILEIFAEESKLKPLYNPKVVVNIRSEAFADERAKALLLKAHSLASERGTIYFACLPEKPESQKESVFSSSGCRLDADFNEDWEIDTLRTGCLGIVAVNLPRIAYECEKDQTQFLGLLKEKLEMAARALEVKYSALRQYGKGLLPFLMRSVNGDQYFRLEASARLVNLIGMKEAIEMFCGKIVRENEKALKLAEEMTQCVSEFTHKIGKRRGKRLLPAMLPDVEASQRLAQLDVDRYGLGQVKFSGTREEPFYSAIGEMKLQEGQVSSDSLIGGQRLRGLAAGGNVTVIELGEAEHKPDELISITRQIAEDRSAQFFTYSRKLTYCANCRKCWFGLLHKCPSCGAVSTLSAYDRFALT
jgi:ribonucleoside-triphosphate reductase